MNGQFITREAIERCIDDRIPPGHIGWRIGGTIHLFRMNDNGDWPLLVQTYQTLPARDREKEAREERERHREPPFWDKSKPMRPGRNYTPVTMKDLEGRLLENHRFQPAPDWLYEPEPRDGTFYPLLEGALGTVNQVRIGGLRMYSSWRKPAPKCSLCGEVWCDCKAKGRVAREELEQHSREKFRGILRRDLCQQTERLVQELEETPE